MLPAVLIQDSGLRSPWGFVADALNAVVWVAFALELALTLRHADDGARAPRALARRARLRRDLPAWAPLFSALGSGWLRGWRLARL